MQTIAVAVAVAVIVVTRQQVVGIERGREGDKCVCVCVEGLKEGAWLCLPAVAVLWGSDMGMAGGWQGDKGSQQTASEVAGDTLNPLRRTRTRAHTHAKDPHAHMYTHNPMTAQAERRKRRERTGTGSKIQLIHDRRANIWKPLRETEGETTRDGKQCMAAL